MNYLNECHSNPWKISYQLPAIKKYSFHQSCLYTAKKIKQNFPNQKPLLLYSGGIDSEIVVRSFMESNIEFDIGVIQFENQLNAHDVEYAFDFCHRHSLDPKIINLDIKEFWGNDLEHYAKISKCTSPQLTTHIKCLEQINRLVIMGGGDPYLFYKKNNKQWYLWEEQKLFCYSRFCKERQRSNILQFFQYTAETLSSFLHDPFILNITKQQPPHDDDSNNYKHDFYEKHFPRLMRRPKYTGFEKVSDLEQYHRKNLEDKLLNTNHIIEIPFQIIKKLFQPTKWPYFSIQRKKHASFCATDHRLD